MSNQQLPLFENRQPLARDTDPITSDIAGAKLTESGKRSSSKMRLLAWMRAHGITCPEAAMTAAEISVWSGFPHPMVHKRLPDLRNDGFIVEATMRTCRVTGSFALARYAKAL